MRIKLNHLIFVHIGIFLSYFCSAQCSPTPPDDDCVNAPLIQTISTYCGNTGSFTADSPNWLNNNPIFKNSTVENSSYFKFIANSSTVEFKICSSNCNNGFAGGIQFLIFKGICNGVTPTTNMVFYIPQLYPGSGISSTQLGPGFTKILVSPYSSGTNVKEVGGCIQVKINGFTIGTTYYVMIDGYEGSVCDFNLNFNNGISILPIELIDYNAKCNNNHVNLSWTTASEINNRHFEIQKSEDAVNYNTIAIVNGHGNSQQLNTYTYTDGDPKTNSKIMYYRLKQVDYDGTFEYFNKTLSLENTCKEVDLEPTIYPNPANQNLTVNIGNDTPVNIEIVNELGQIIYNNVCLNHLDIETTNFAAGIYAIRINNKYKTVIKKLVITH